MSLPADARPGPSKAASKRNGLPMDQVPLRTREEIHVCGSFDSDLEDDDAQANLFSHSLHTIYPDSSCHNHNLEFVSSANPVEAEAFSILRRATLRTLSGEQLLRGQTCGRLWFGDPTAGYTIAYVFRLADLHARGRQRYYALLALAGSDTHRAFEACTIIWSLFEQIATNIVRMAEEVALRKTDNGSPQERGQITPISSFLTGRTMDPDGFPRHGAVNVRANGIAELVNNDNFFCELHMIFVSILQELGRMLGGMRVRPVHAEHSTSSSTGAIEQACMTHHEDERVQQSQAEQDDTVESRPPILGRSPNPAPTQSTPRCPTPLCSPIMTAHRHQVMA